MTDDTRLRWPTGTDYSRAVQSPQHSFCADELTSTEPVISAMGVPMAATGQNAVVFLLRDLMQRSFALRCFTTPASDGAARYRALAAHLSTLPTGTALAAATWIEDGVLVGERHWPAVLMPWVSGKPMNLAVEDMLDDDPSKLGALADNWLLAVGQLQASRIAHGDLQHGNVLVAEDGQVTLVDLDGVWVPNSSLPPPNEVGHPNYQHPGREGRHWGQHVDSFSALLIETSLRALAADPSLGDLMAGENLVVSRPDLVNPTGSEAWARLAASPDANVRGKVAVLRGLLAAPFEDSLRPLSELGSGTPLPVTAPVAPAMSSPAIIAPPSAAVGNWWDQNLRPDATVARPPLSAPAPTSAHIPAPQQAVAASTRRIMGRSPEAAGAIGGLLAGLFGCALYGALKMSFDSLYRPALFVSLVAALIGGFALGWQPLVAGQSGVALKRFGLGLGVGAVAGVASILPADWVMKAMLELPAHGRTTEFSPIPVALVWAIVAALVGLAIGALQNARGAAFGFVGGAVAGFAGGLLYGATVAEFDGTRLVIVQWRPLTVVITGVVTALIGLAVGAARKRAALGTLTVIEGDLKGLEVLLKRSSSIGSSKLSNTLAVSGLGGYVNKVVDLEIDDGGRCSITTYAPIRINGAEHPAGSSTVKSGDVLMVGTSYIRLKLRDQNGSAS